MPLVVDRLVIALLPFMSLTSLHFSLHPPSSPFLSPSFLPSLLFVATLPPSPSGEWRQWPRLVRPVPPHRRSPRLLRAQRARRRRARVLLLVLHPVQPGPLHIVRMVPGGRAAGRDERVVRGGSEYGFRGVHGGWVSGCGYVLTCVDMC